MTRVRRAEPGDVAAVLSLIHDLAEYERQPDQVETSEDDLRRALFPASGSPTVFAHVADVDGTIVGIAIWFLTFSTWTGRNGIWLEDLYVDAGRRRHGIGRALLAALAAECLARGYARLEWSVLDWNEPAIAFYRELGAGSQDEWTTNRLTGDVLRRLGSG